MQSSNDPDVNHRIALNQMAGKATGERIPGEKYRAIVEAAAIGDPDVHSNCDSCKRSNTITS